MRITSKLCLVKWGRCISNPRLTPRLYKADAHCGYHSLYIKDWEIRIFKWGHRCTPFVAGERKRAFVRFIFKKYYTYIYRHQDPDVCCCGSRMGHGGDICHHGGCRSMLDYTIECATEKAVNRVAPWPTT